MNLSRLKPVKKRSVSDDLILSLDVGTEFVKAVIGKKSDKEVLKILASKKLRQSPGAMIDGGIADISSVVETCEKVISLAEKAAGVSVKKTVVGIAGELVKGNTATIRYRRANGSKLITEAEIKLLLEKIEKRALEKAKKDLSLEADNPDLEIRLINSALVSLTIDGYKISNPVGFKGSEVKVQYYTAFAPLIHISAIEKVCSELNLDLVAVAVEPFAVCRACLGEDPESDFSGIVVDIGGGTTDIAVINSGGVEGTKMFNIGGRSFTRQIAEGLGIDFDEAEELKLALNDNKIDDALRGRASAAVEKNLSVWLAGVELALAEFKSVDVLPKEIFLCGGGAGLGLLQESLALSDWYKKLPFSRRPVINLVDPELLPDFEFSSDLPLDFSYITALGLLRVGVDTSITSPEKSDLKEKMKKLLSN
ncbi:rod shape-determining protein [Candidatus Saccharibacteria bacterium]|nr:rod shape-determining protein [Candidatus Saccharibacteria bacterium]